MTEPMQALKCLADCQCPQCGNYAAVSEEVRGDKDVPGAVMGYRYELSCFYCGVFTVAIFTQIKEPEPVGILEAKR